jgi:hypothetical protein
MRGAQITVRCDCGEIAFLAYGERWACPKCRRSWNTSQIPEDEYWGIMRDMRRLRLTIVGIALCLAAPIAALTPFLGPRILLLLPLVMGFWYLFYMPRWRRRVREQTRSLRRWKLRPE